MKVRGSRIVVAIFLALVGCRQAPQEQGKADYDQTGIASWYGLPHHGRLTASGEVFDMTRMTAAHRTLRFGTRVRVRHLARDKEVEVRINDRGPFKQGRIIDLSRDAAQRIEISGIADVGLRIVSIPKARAPDMFGVQVAELGDEKQATDLSARLRPQHGAVVIVPVDSEPHMWRVIVGNVPAVEEADRLAARLSEEFGPVFVVRIDESDAAAEN
jgi:rare lipoprotein A